MLSFLLKLQPFLKSMLIESQTFALQEAPSLEYLLKSWYLIK